MTWIYVSSAFIVIIVKQILLSETWQNVYWSWSWIHMEEWFIFGSKIVSMHESKIYNLN